MSNPTDSTPTRKRGRQLLVFTFTVVCLLFVVWLYLPIWIGSQIDAAFYKQDLQAAQLWIERGLSVFPENATLLRSRARYHRKLSRFDEMNRDLKSAVRAGMSRELLKLEQMLAGAQTGELRPLQSELGVLLANLPEEQPEICDAYVRGCMQLYQLEEAQKMLQMWETDFPHDPRPYFLRGRMLEHESDFEGAVNHFQNALQRSPRHAPAAYNMARILFTQKEYQQAIDAYELAQQALWSPYPCQLGIVECLLELDQIEQAQKSMKSLDETQPENEIEIFRYLGDPTYLALSRYDSIKGRLELASEDYDQAIASFESALQKNPKDWRTRIQYSMALKQAGRFEEGQQQAIQVSETQKALEECDDYIRKINQDPDDVETRFLIGTIMFEHVSEAQGRVWIYSALKIDPGYQPALDFLRTH